MASGSVVPQARCGSGRQRNMAIRVCRQNVTSCGSIVRVGHLVQQKVGRWTKDVSVRRATLMRLCAGNYWRRACRDPCSGANRLNRADSSKGLTHRTLLRPRETRRVITTFRWFAEIPRARRSKNLRDRAVICCTWCLVNRAPRSARKSRCQCGYITDQSAHLD